MLIAVGRTYGLNVKTNPTPNGVEQLKNTKR